MPNVSVSNGNHPQDRTGQEACDTTGGKVKSALTVESGDKCPFSQVLPSAMDVVER